MRLRSVILLLIVIAVTVFGAFFIHPQYWGDKRPWRLGLDLVGGSSLVYEVDMTGIEETEKGAVMSGLRDVIENRINLFGVSEPKVVSAKRGDSYRLIIEIAAIKDIAKAIELIGETPFLYFAEEGADEAGNLTFTPTDFTGRYIKAGGRGAQVVLNQITGQPEIDLIFTDEGAKLFEELTRKNVNKRIAIYVDGLSIIDTNGDGRVDETDPPYAPVVQSVIAGGRAQITGSLTLPEAQTLVSRFNAGALSAPIDLISQQTIGATLGADSLKKTILAGIIGTLAIIVFMLIYYHHLGIFASLALIIYSILLLVIFKLFGITMTLAGIAGIILSIGMAVDANILIFERTKEERKKGGAKTSAIKEGFHRAWPSIRDSNIATIITSLILYNLTSSFIRGFALALFLGVIVSMFTAITITRVLLQIFIKEKHAASTKY